VPWLWLLRRPASGLLSTRADRRDRLA
jgi:hypothetical protein